MQRCYNLRQFRIWLSEHKSFSNILHRGSVWCYNSKAILIKTKLITKHGRLPEEISIKISYSPHKSFICSININQVKHNKSIGNLYIYIDKEREGEREYHTSDQCRLPPMVWDSNPSTRRVVETLGYLAAEIEEGCSLRWRLWWSWWSLIKLGLLCCCEEPGRLSLTPSPFFFLFPIKK